ncbi:MAG: acetylornithine deacetylase [Gammaproteobacteria bacterium]
MSNAPLSLPVIEQLIAFDTTSRNTNLECIAFIQSLLDDAGIEPILVHDDTGTKANLYATLGPADRSGYALSGHTDVVPVDGQDWSSDPFTVRRENDRLYGRGTSDMKSFIGVCLALTPEFLAREIETPLHLCFSYDEEIGCIGVRGLLDYLREQPVRPKGCIIGEPTMMGVMRAHKGKLSHRCTVHGHASHSSLTHQGVNAVEAAAETIAYLKSMARRLRDHGPYDRDYDPPHTTVHTGLIRGGTQLNIVPSECFFDFEFRHLPVDDPLALFSEVQRFVAEHVLPEMHATNPDTGFDWSMLSHSPGLNTDEDAPITQLCKALTGANHTGTVAFGTEAGLFSADDMPAIVCGPGSIEQAHKPDEYIEIGQIAECERFIRRLFERCWGSG